MSFDDPEVRKFLARSMILRLAALSPKGVPNIRCLWFVCRRRRIYIFTADVTPMGRSILAHPDVALLFDGERGPQSGRVLLVRGHAAFRGEGSIVASVMLALARKYFLTRPGLRNLLAYAGKILLTLRFYAQPWWELRRKEPRVILEVVPESFEFLPRSQAQAAS